MGRVTVPKGSTSAEGMASSNQQEVCRQQTGEGRSIRGASYIGLDRSLQRVGLVNNPKAATPHMTSRRTRLANRKIQPFISCMAVMVCVGAVWDELGGRGRRHRPIVPYLWLHASRTEIRATIRQWYVPSLFCFRG